MIRRTQSRSICVSSVGFFFFQAEDGIRDVAVTGVQTCALPIYATFSVPKSVSLLHASLQVRAEQARRAGEADAAGQWSARAQTVWDAIMAGNQIGRASCRGRG